MLHHSPWNSLIRGPSDPMPKTLGAPAVLNSPPTVGDRSLLSLTTVSDDPETRMNASMHSSLQAAFYNVEHRFTEARRQSYQYFNFAWHWCQATHNPRHEGTEVSLRPFSVIGR